MTDIASRTIEALNPEKVLIAVQGPFRDSREADGSAELGVEELAVSILCYGQAQAALVTGYVAEEDGEAPEGTEYVVGVGRRRHRAAKLLRDWRREVVNFDDDQLAEWADAHECPFEAAKGLRDVGAPDYKAVVVERDEIRHASALVSLENAQRKSLTKGEIIDERQVVFKEALRVASARYDDDKDIHAEAMKAAASACGVSLQTFEKDMIIAENAPAAVRRALRLGCLGMKATEAALILNRGDEAEIKELTEKAAKAVEEFKAKPQGEAPARAAKGVGKKTREEAIAALDSFGVEDAYARALRDALAWIHSGTPSEELKARFIDLGLTGAIYGVEKPAAEKPAKASKAKGKAKTAKAKPAKASKAKAAAK